MEENTLIFAKTLDAPILDADFLLVYIIYIYIYIGRRFEIISNRRHRSKSTLHRREHRQGANPRNTRRRNKMHEDNERERYNSKRKLGQISETMEPNNKESPNPKRSPIREDLRNGPKG